MLLVCPCFPAEDDNASLFIRPILALKVVSVSIAIPMPSSTLPSPPLPHHVFSVDRVLASFFLFPRPLACVHAYLRTPDAWDALEKRLECFQLMLINDMPKLIATAYGSPGDAEKIAAILKAAHDVSSCAARFLSYCVVFFCSFCAAFFLLLLRHILFFRATLFVVFAVDSR